MTKENLEHDTEDAIDFVDEISGEDTPLDFYLLLIVDDNADVHVATRIALQGQIINGRRLLFMSAYSAREAILMVDKHIPFDLVLLDMVMETTHAGMDVAQNIQARLDLEHTPAIVMRSGQPGMFKDKDVDDNLWFDEFMLKSRVTQQYLRDIVQKHLDPDKDLGLTHI